MKKLLLIIILINLFSLIYAEEDLDIYDENYIQQEEQEPVTGKSIFFTNSNQIKIEIKDHSNDFKMFNQNTSDTKEETTREQKEDENIDEKGEDRGTEKEE
ncbi:Uncharacterised protein [Fusobacterium necrogenes]|uniref:Uncharacterized protein n=1 Tax=Fusobacterium necrogenes TaxID=858 RepID=A0A377GP52_9FUSO|nr:hypothetical protein [Fusobacterium necrogenes]STO28760.1 Uncharacterised protein [Fusobacterium necrogenes]